jgi:hypothetical protein
VYKLGVYLLVIRFWLDSNMDDQGLPGQSSTIEGPATCCNTTKQLDEEHFIDFSDFLFHVGDFWRVESEVVEL